MRKYWLLSPLTKCSQSLQGRQIAHTPRLPSTAQFFHVALPYSSFQIRLIRGAGLVERIRHSCMQSIIIWRTSEACHPILRARPRLQSKQSNQKSQSTPSEYRVGQRRLVVPLLGGARSVRITSDVPGRKSLSEPEREECVESPSAGRRPLPIRHWSCRSRGTEPECRSFCGSPVFRHNVRR